MKIKYGTFEFESWEAGLAYHVQAVESPHGFRKTLRVQIDIEGEVCTTDQYAVTTRLAAIHAAMVNYQDLKLLHDNSTTSHHVLISNHVNNLTGNQVRQVSFPQTVGAEYANGRKFRYLIEAELDAAESEIIEWVDTIKIVGNAGAAYRWRHNPQWGSYPEKISTNTPQRVLHEGYCVGMNVRLAPASPLYLPPFELNHMREIEFTSGRRHPQAITERITRWRYHYYLPTFDNTLRPTPAPSSAIVIPS